MDTQLNSQFFSVAETNMALNRLKLTAQPHSPLAPFLQEGARGSVVDLDAKLASSAEWPLAWRILAAPDYSVRALTAGAAGLLESYYFGLRDGEISGLVGCWAEQDGLRVSFPWDNHSIASASLLALTPADFIPRRTEPLVLSPAGLTAFAAVLDTVRQDQIDGLASRRPEARAQFGAPAVIDQAAVGLAHDDRRWLVTLLRELAPPPVPPRYEHLDAGFPELIVAGVITAASGNWVPADWVRELAARWYTPLPAAALGTLTHRDGADQAGRHLIAIRGSGALWTFVYDGIAAGTPRIICQNSGLADCHAAFQQATNGALAFETVAQAHAPVAPPAGQPQPRFCSYCGGALKPGAKFCTSCGQPLPGM
ncbi:zinc ribbon domain-containing protein [bacterium]|nr:zinc ribbon domain-containing protein [bacterium]